MFHKSQDGDLEYWALQSDLDLSSSAPASFTLSLEDLRDALSRGYRERNKFNYTFKALTDLTGFLSRETYTLYGGSSSLRHGFMGGHPLGPAEEDVRREIRALKGLVLNRCVEYSRLALIGISCGIINTDARLLQPLTDHPLPQEPLEFHTKIRYFSGDKGLRWTIYLP